jgi:hypothetical protein
MVEENEDTRTPLGIDLRFYILSPFKFGTGMKIPELYGFEFGKDKTISYPAPLSYLTRPQHQSGSGQKSRNQ